MLNDYYYHETLKKLITVFGTIFNNITVARVDHNTGRVSNVQKVPIAYGPQKKFMARIEGIEKSQMAVKLPRMGFEITSIDYDSQSKLNKLNRVRLDDGTGESALTQLQSVPYNIGISLSIFGSSQDDTFQIMEQVLPLFTPEYTVTVKDMKHSGSSTDLPFVINSVNLEDTYEGDFKTRRAIINTLDFMVKLSFAGPVVETPIIKAVDIDFYDKMMSEVDYDPDPISEMHVDEDKATITIMD